MNYSRHYTALMERAEGRVLTCYTEKHHVVPRCMDKTSTYVVRLTPEEHYVAHLLLVKMHPDNTKLLFAARQMTFTCKNSPRNNKLFGWLRRRTSESLKGNKHSLGFKHTEESKELISEANRLRICIADTPEVIAEKTRLVALKAEIKELAHQQSVAVSRERQNEALRTAALAMKGRPMSAQHYANHVAAKQRQKGRPNKPHRLSEEGRAARVAANKARKGQKRGLESPEVCANKRAAWVLRKARAATLSTITLVTADGTRSEVGLA